MKNLSLILNIVLFALVGHLYYLNLSGKTPSAADAVILPPASAQDGIKIAYVNADTLDANYEWLKQQKQMLEQKQSNAENTMYAKKESFMKEMAAFQSKAEAGNTPRADLEKEYAVLQQREQNLAQEEQRLGKQLSDQYTKSMKDMYSNLEGKLKELSSQIGYDYILSYSRGGQILMANDSLDITKQVLNLLNAKEQK